MWNFIGRSPSDQKKVGEREIVSRKEKIFKYVCYFLPLVSLTTEYEQQTHRRLLLGEQCIHCNIQSTFWCESFRKRIYLIKRTKNSNSC